MSVLAKKLVVWLILVALPAQGLAAVTRALQGPAHYHSAAHASTQPEAAGTAHASDHRHDSHPGHVHDRVKRHYHLPGEDAVVVQDDQQNDPAAAEARNPRGESASAAFVALIPDCPALHLPDLDQRIGRDDVKKLFGCTLRRIERPPRHLPA